MNKNRLNFTKADSTTLRRVMKHAPSREARQLAYGILANRKTLKKVG